MYRISVTTLEKYRRFVTDASPFDTEQALLESIKGTFLGNDKTFVGGAFHKLIEGDFNFDGQLYYADNIAFSPDQAEPAFEYKRQHLRMIHEVPVTKWYVSHHGPILISGRLDGMEGIEARDGKTKFRKVNWQEYHDSYQWRFYQDMTGMSVFYYDVFEVIGFEALEGNAPYKLPGVYFSDHESYRCVRYPGMHQDCQQLLDEFLSYIAFRGLFNLLKPAQQVTT